MRFDGALQLAPVKAIRCIKRDADTFFIEQKVGDFLPRFAPLALLVNGARRSRRFSVVLPIHVEAG